MKNILVTMIWAAITITVNAQTNVHGGIYNNTTWTLANSPYVVTDTIVVFPGVTLTIEPGVTVKFEDGKYVEVRQGSLIASGTASDSITITSNSASPTKGIYRGFVFNNPVAITTDYCIFKYADNPLAYCCFTIDTLFIQHSYFYMNTRCTSGNYSITFISQSTFENNTYCIEYSPHLISVHNSLFQNNINCFGDYNIDQVSNLTLDSCTFINNVIAARIGNTCLVTNCLLSNNTFAFKIESGSSITNHTIKSCTFCNNGTAVMAITNFSSNGDTLMNCNFSNNGSGFLSIVAYMTGNVFTENNMAVDFRIQPTDSVFNNYIFHNNIGVNYHGGASSKFFNNYICNNTYNINYNTNLNGTIPPVCYCETDSATIRSKIYDGYQDIARGLLDFTPYINCDSSAINAIPPISCPAVIITDVTEGSLPSKPMMEIFPNPATNAFKIKNLSSNEKVFLQIINSIGEVVYTETLYGDKEHLIKANFARGIYFVKVNEHERIVIGKLVIE